MAPHDTREIFFHATSHSPPQNHGSPGESFGSAKVASGERVAILFNAFAPQDLYYP